MSSTERPALIRWGAWYFLITSGLVAIVGARFLVEYTWPDSWLGRLYTLSAFLGHFAVLGLAPWVLLVLPLTLLLPVRRLVMPVSVMLAALLLAFVQIDSLVFAADRFHISALALRVLGAPTLIFSLIFFVIALGATSIVAHFVWRRLTSPGRGKEASAVAGVLAGLFLVSQALHVWADASYYLPITRFTPYLPLYRPLTAKHLLARWLDVVDLERARQASAIEGIGAQSGTLRYPARPLRCSPPEQPLDVVIIGLDAMRADMLNPRVAPNMADFAEDALLFENHWSGGNGTRPGLFSLFYGIPATYFRAFYASRQAPVLVESFQQHGYDVAVFPSNPADGLVGLERTAFATVPNLPTRTGDLAVTEGWLGWLEQRDPQRPFFGFLFYESAPGGCREEYPRVSDVPLDAPGDAGRRACYETAVHFADSQVGRVLEGMRRLELLDQTIVIITSDHGEEFNENGQGFRGHGSAYSPYQLRTPMLVHWPGRAAGRVTKRTSHNDVAPTLLSDVLGCANPPSEYSSGQSLFAEHGWKWLVASSYTGLAIIEPNQITISYGGYYEVRDHQYRLLEDPHLEPETIAAAITETGRFLGD